MLDSINGEPLVIAMKKIPIDLLLKSNQKYIKQNLGSYLIRDVAKIGKVKFFCSFMKTKNLLDEFEQDYVEDIDKEKLPTT